MFKRGENQRCTDTLPAAVVPDRQRFYLDGRFKVRAHLGQNLPGHAARKDPVAFAHQETVDVLNDFAEGARHQFPGTSAYHLKNGLRVFESGWLHVM
jgi:hypothetical protein